MSADDKRKDTLRARESILTDLTEAVDLNKDGSMVSLDTWTRLHHVLDLPQLGPSDVRDLHRNVFSYLISNDLFYTAAVFLTELAGKAFPKETGQESTTAGQTSVPIESHKSLQDSKKRPEVHTQSVSQIVEGSHASRPRFPGSASQPVATDYHQRPTAPHSLSKPDNIMPIVPSSDASSSSSYDIALQRRHIPRRKASMVNRAKEYAAKVFKGPDNQNNGRKLKDTARNSAALSSESHQPLISPSRSDLFKDPNLELPNQKKR